MERQEEIRSKGFNMYDYSMFDYNSIKVGNKNLEDAIINLSSLKEQNKKFTKSEIIRALEEKNVKLLREISKLFYRTNGIYQRACDYLATMYRFDWYVVPEVYDENVSESKVMTSFTKTLNYLDNSYIKKVCGDIALKVIKNGVYYGYCVSNGRGLVLQELPVKYCRSRYFVGNNPAVEFNLKFFDEKFPDAQYRMRVLKMFPKEFAQAYSLYKQGKLNPDYQGDQRDWYLLDPDMTVKFEFNDSNLPVLVNAIPAIIDLENAQELDRRKQLQKLLKIIVQKLPLDKNGELIFDVEEARDIHNNAVQMLQNAIGVDVLTTFTDVESIDMSDSATTTTKDDLQKVERTVFNSFGISQNLFNTDGNLSLEKSILNDEGSMRKLLLQFQVFFDKITQGLSKNPKKFNFRLYMLETTQYNYKELSKIYKEQVQLGYSKMLPQVAMGHSQSAIINTAYFENNVMHLSEIMIPPLMSSTMNGEDLQALGEKKTGRPEKEEDQKSDKTIANEESMS